MIPQILLYQLLVSMSPCNEVRSTSDDCIKTVWTVEETPRHVGWLVPIPKFECDSMMRFKPNPKFDKQLKSICI